MMLEIRLYGPLDATPRLKWEMTAMSLNHLKRVKLNITTDMLPIGQHHDQQIEAMVALIREKLGQWVRTEIEVALDDHGVGPAAHVVLTLNLK